MGNFRHVRKVISVFVICCFIVGVLVDINAYGYYSMFCWEGDNGGPVYRVDGTGNRIALGVVSGVDLYNTYLGYFSPLYYANQAGFTLKVN